MQRRQFLSQLAWGAGALALSSPLRALNADPNAAFAAGLDRHPWLLGWQDAALPSGQPMELQVEGRLPAALNGVLYRNGPGRFSRAGVRYRHWFDGDGLLQAWTIRGGRIQHRARFVATHKFRREEAAGRFLLPAAGTAIDAADAIRNSDAMSTANTAVLEHGGAVYALWEGGSAWQVDPDSLQAIGPKTWREDLASMPFSAHPLHEADGSLWNLGLSGRQLFLWHIDAGGELRSLDSIETPFPGYLHAFSQTERYLVFVLLPFVFEPGTPGTPYFDSLHWRPERGCRALVLDKHDRSHRRWYGLPAGAAYHYGPARQLGRAIELQACWIRDGEAARSPFQAELAGRSERIDSSASLERIVLHLDSGRASMETLVKGSVDFPVFDTKALDGSGYALTAADDSESGYFAAIARFDPQHGEIDRYHYGAGMLVEEHRFVAMPGAQRPNQGWLIGTVLDYHRRRSGLSVLNAENLAAGPLAQAWLPHTLPLGFHGWFASRA